MIVEPFLLLALTLLYAVVSYGHPPRENGAEAPKHRVGKNLTRR